MTIVLASISLIISCAAFTFGIFTWNENRNRARRDLRLQIHERLVAVDLQRGRRILYNKVHSNADARSLFFDHPDEYDLANRALAMLDVAALYAERGYIDVDSFMGDWAFVYANISEHGRYFITERAERSRTTFQNWPHFRSFAERASLWLAQERSSLSLENPVRDGD